MKNLRHFGKKWTLERDGDEAWITDAVSAATVMIDIGSDGSISVYNLKRYMAVPQYIRKIIEHLLSKGK